MVNSSVNDLSHLINRNLCHYEEIAGLLCKAEALAEIGQSNGFLEQEEDTQRHYFWTLRDLLAEANELNEKYLAEEMRHLRQVEQSNPKNAPQPTCI